MIGRHGGNHLLGRRSQPANTLNVVLIQFLKMTRRHRALHCSVCDALNVSQEALKCASCREVVAHYHSQQIVITDLEGEYYGTRCRSNDQQITTKSV